MTENVENLILEHLRGIRGDIGGLKEDMREAKQRLNSIEAAIAGLRRDNAHVYSPEGYASRTITHTGI